MNDEVVEDLKQFIAATVSQNISEVVERLDKVDGRLDSVERKIDDLSGYVAEALESSNEATDMQLKDHNKRITRLEHKAA